MKAEEKRARRETLGASEFAAILGLDPWKKPIDVYAAKVGLIEEEDDPEEGPAAWGRFLEGVLLTRWQAETGIRLTRRRQPRTFRHPKHSFISATPDGYRVPPLTPRGTRAHRRAVELVVEAKTSRTGKGFGESGTDEIPIHYKVQGIVQSAVTGAPVVHFPVLIAGHDFRRYLMQPTDEQRETIIDAGVEFWNENVLARKEPDEISEQYARRRWPEETEAELVATAEDEQLVERLRRARIVKEQGSVAEEEAKAAIMGRMGDYARLLGPGFRISWRKSKDREETDWKLVAGDFERALREAAGRGFAPAGGGTIDEAIAFVESMHTTTRTGSRVFRPTWDEED